MDAASPEWMIGRSRIETGVKNAGLVCPGPYRRPIEPPLRSSRNGPGRSGRTVEGSARPARRPPVVEIAGLAVRRGRRQFPGRILGGLEPDRAALVADPRRG